MRLIVFADGGSEETERFFFSTSHIQPNLDDEWVPITFYSCETKEELKKIYYLSATEIPNPDPKYQG
jgi:hypothetical protein